MFKMRNLKVHTLLQVRFSFILFQVFEETGIRPSYKTGYPSEGALKNLKKKCGPSSYPVSNAADNAFQLHSTTRDSKVTITKFTKPMPRFKKLQRKLLTPVNVLRQLTPPSIIYLPILTLNRDEQKPLRGQERP